MLYVIYGSDHTKAREKVRALVDSLRAKKPDASLVRVDVESFDESRLEELLHGQGLFAQKCIVMCDRLLGNKDTKDSVVKNLKRIGASDNIFIFLEDELSKTILQKIGKHAEKVQEHKARPARSGTMPFNRFALTDALGRRSRKTLWTLFARARRDGISDEEIASLLFWQVKTMALARAARTAGDAGLAPFAFQKAKQFQRNYSEAELFALSRALVLLAHNSRRGLSDSAVALERFILGV